MKVIELKELLESFTDDYAEITAEIVPNCGTDLKICNIVYVTEKETESLALRRIKPTEAKLKIFLEIDN